MEVDIIKDLTDRTPRKPRRFKLDPDVFECAAKLPAGVVQDVSALRKGVLLIQSQQAAGIEPDEEFVERLNTTFFGMLDVILLRESAERFAKRMRDPENPIDTEDIQRFIAWVIEAYGGGRPTTPSSDSSTSLPTTGTSSTDGVLPGPSIPVPSMPIGS